MRPIHTLRVRIRHSPGSTEPLGAKLRLWGRRTWARSSRCPSHSGSPALLRSLRRDDGPTGFLPWAYGPVAQIQNRKNIAGDQVKLGSSPGSCMVSWPKWPLSLRGLFRCCLFLDRLMTPNLSLPRRSTGVHAAKVMRIVLSTPSLNEKAHCWSFQRCFKPLLLQPSCSS